MNIGELPFLDVPPFPNPVIAAVHRTTKTLCLNSNVEFNDEQLTNIEKNCVGLLSHETIHAILLSRFEMLNSSGYDFFDGMYNQYKISLGKS